MQGIELRQTLDTPELTHPKSAGFSPTANLQAEEAFDLHRLLELSTEH
jgi:hypothetical protein